MTRIHSLLVGVLAVVVVVAACGAPTPPSASPITTPPGGHPTEAVASPSIDPNALRYTCGAFPFAPDLLDAGPGSDELADTPIAAALRVHLAQPGPDFDFLPDAGWRLIGFDGAKAEFIAVRGDGNLAQVGVENNGGVWKVSGWGDCNPQIALAPGLGNAAWAFDPDQPEPDATTQVFDALVTEMSCNSGKPADGRIVGPQIVKTAETVLVFFAVRPRPGAHDCPSNPATRVTVDLGEPLGNRVLLDGGRLPPGDPAIPPF